MKKSLKKSLFAGIVLLTLSTPFNLFAGYAGWDYKSTESFDRMDGRTYLVSHCEDKIGDDCTTPYSATRFDVSIVVELLEGYGILKRF